MEPFTGLCVELLAPLGRVRVRRMFGGQGLYVDELFIAIISRGELFLKSDDANAARFDAAGCAHFTFEHKGGEPVATRYRRPPEEALESPDGLRPWARLAMEAALRAANAKPARRPRRSAAEPAAPKQTAPRRR